MSTLGELITAISNRLLDQNGVAVSSSSITEAINDSIKYYKHKTFYFNQEFTTFTVASGSSTLASFPTDFLAFGKGGMAIQYSQQKWPLRVVTPSEFDLEDIEGTGPP